MSKRMNKIGMVHDQFLSKTQRSSTIRGSRAKFAKSIIKKSIRDSKEMIAVAETIDKVQFKKFEGMIEGLKRTSHFALLYEFLLVARRILLLYMAMFVRDMAWMHIQLFMTTNVLFLIYLGSLKPFISQMNNYWHIFNEATCLAVAYFVFCVNNPSYGPTINVDIGSFVAYILYSSWGMNFLFVILITSKETFLKCKRFYNHRLRQKLCKKGKSNKSETR